MTRINQKEYWFLKRLDDKWKWIARDRDSLLYVFSTKPGKGKIYAVWRSIKDGDDHDYWEIENKDLFQFVQWKDSEPYNIAELIRGYEWAQLNEKYPPVGESEETEVRSKQELIEKWELAIEAAEFYGKGKEERLVSYMKDFVSDLNQLEESEVLSQEEIDQAYKDGYEKGKQHTFYKGYLEGLADKENEPETVADVMSDFWKSFERLKEVMSMEVEEMAMTRKASDTYRPIVHIFKVKKGKPTVIKVSGEEYVLRHKDQYKGRIKGEN